MILGQCCQREIRSGVTDCVAAPCAETYNRHWHACCCADHKSLAFIQATDKAAILLNRHHTLHRKLEHRQAEDGRSFG